MFFFFFFFKQKTAYEMRISDWSSDVCSSDLRNRCRRSPARSGAATEIRPDLQSRLCGLALALSGESRTHPAHQRDRHQAADRKSVVSGKSVSVRVDLGGRRIIKKKKKIRK